MIENEALKLDFEGYFANEAANIYKNLNPKSFKDFKTVNLFKNVLNLVFKIHSQSPLIVYTDFKKPVFTENNKVLLAFSGGLDSTYQALYLRNKGMDVKLLHLANLNTYSNGQELKVAKEFAEKFDFPIEIVKFSAKQKGEFKKFWQENSFKDFLIYSVAVDIMLRDKIGILSSGDDKRLDAKDVVVGTNVSDAKQLTEMFMKDFGINFVPVDENITKDMRLKYLYDNNAQDYYNSCVGPGRLIQSQRLRYESKFNVKLDKWNCCTCRKCCFHILANYYYNGIKYPEEMINRCWNKISIGADNKWFDKSLPIEEKINNLRSY